MAWFVLERGVQFEPPSVDSQTRSFWASRISLVTKIRREFVGSGRTAETLPTGVSPL